LAACSEVWSNSEDGNLYYAGEAYTEDECSNQLDETNADDLSDTVEAEDQGSNDGYDAAFSAGLNSATAASAGRGPTSDGAPAILSRLARRSVNGRRVWWWQLVADPEDTRQPCWLDRRQALSYMEAVLDRLAVVR